MGRNNGIQYGPWVFDGPGLPTVIADRLAVTRSGCWQWTGRPASTGYAQATYRGRLQNVHRGVWMLLVGVIPEGLHLDHLCRNRLCANPDHLQPVTPEENARRGVPGVYQTLKTHCPSGHEYSAANTRVDRRGHRYCRSCNRIRTQRRRALL